MTEAQESNGVGSADALQQRALDVLAPFVTLRTNDDGSLGFEYAGALCSMRAVNLSPGLDVLSLTCVLAWDRPLRAPLTKRVADRNNALQFGSITIIGNGKLADVIMRYTFPAAGLTDEALMTMLLLVLSGADRSRQGLVP
ncbi:YbjN domain-containing protein [Antrihabitans sp. NCIMB 15449]|jgi:hypothetical protein|uniref:YbjN domain-containing protein n=2 Tax=Antrihabitans TaxID=2799491 RepID=A0A934NVY6_9NOCA|nr:YbjN domain-containing protein [Antrihabitans stalagmiti]MBJ8342278.1 YbjN domain-containing protein [Antrihabitans stalagmiti]